MMTWRCLVCSLNGQCPGIIIIIIIIIMSLTPVSSSDKDIGGVPSMQSSYSAEMKRNVDMWRGLILGQTSNSS